MDWIVPPGFFWGNCGLDSPSFFGGGTVDWIVPPVFFGELWTG